MFPDTPTIKDHFKAISTVCIVYTVRVKNESKITGFIKATVFQVKVRQRLLGQTSRMKNQG